jgi:VWFA-related protein
MRTRLSICLYIAAVAATLAAQANQGDARQQAQPTFRSGANYVRVDMYATVDGQPVGDLRQEEVEILEDGVPQPIEAFEHVVVRPVTVQESRNEPDGLQASREAAADPRARLFVIFLDTYHTTLVGSASIRQPLVGFLERALGPDDLVALVTPEMAASEMTFGRKTTVIADVLREEWWGRRADRTNEDPKEFLYRTCAARQQLGGGVAEEMIGRRREKLTLDALEDLLVHTAGLREGRKAVVVVTEGWLLYEPKPDLAKVNPEVGPARPEVFRPPVRPPSAAPETGTLDQPALIECEADRNMLAFVDHPRRLREIGEEANRGNVTFYPVHPRGLVVFDSDISQNVPIAQDSANLRTRLDSMRALAIDTDGDALVNTNNIASGLKRIADDLSSYYLIGYYSTNSKLDGRFREITVRVKRPGVRVRARRGYRGRTAEEVISRAAAEDPARAAITDALNSVASLNARSTFRVRPSAWSRLDGDAVAGAVWLVGELDYRTRRELAWTAGAQADITVLAADGTQVAAQRIEVPAGEGSFAAQLPESGTLPAGDYAVSIRLRPESGSDLALTDTVRVVIPDRPAALGEAVLWRRGPSTGPRYLRTADPRFQRNERLRLEMATSAEGAPTARLLDRAGKALQVPVQTSLRADAQTGLRWVVADATLAPLAAGDYAVEVSLGEARQVTGFRVVP